MYMLAESKKSDRFLLYSNAFASYRTGNFEKAVLHLQNYLQDNPGDEDGLRFLAVIQGNNTSRDRRDRRIGVQDEQISICDV
jgi:Flp pilus assembly protein TadD